MPRRRAGSPRPQLAGDDPRTEWCQLVEPLDERGAEKLQVAADAAAQDHELGIEHGADGRDDQSQALALPIHRASCRRVAAARGVEDASRREPGRHAQRDSVLDHALR